MQIPWRGWKDIFVRTYYEIQDDRLLALAAGVVFYSLVALFPAHRGGGSSYALFANAATIGKHLSIAADIVPAGALDLLGEEISRIAAKSDGKLTFGFLLGLGIALWSANAGMKAIFDALNIIYDEEEKRGIVWLNRGVAVLHRSAPSPGPDWRLPLVVVFPLLLAAFGLTSVDAADHRLSALAGDVRADDPRARRALPIRSEPPAGEVALDQRRQRRCRARLACDVVAVFLVPRQFRQLQRHLRCARRGGRPDDVDVALDDHRAGRRASSIPRSSTRPRATTTVGPEKPLGTRGAVMADTVGRRPA